MVKHKVNFVENFHAEIFRLLHEKIVDPPLEPILHPSSRRIFWLGLFTLVGHPLFLWLWGHFLPQPYENSGLRFMISLLGLVLMLPYVNRDPYSLKANIIFCSVFFIQMPLFFTWMYLCNSGNTVWLASLSMMILIWYHITDWRLATVGLILGSAMAWLLFKIIGPETAPLGTTILLTNAVVIAFSVSMALLLGALSANARQLIKTLNEEREQALVALAGSIAHEMRNPLGHIRYASDSILSSFERPDTITSDQVISAEATNKIYHHLTQIFTAVNRGLQVIDITLQEVANKPIDSANFDYLSAAALTEKAIEEYSFDSIEDYSKVVLRVLNDFTFKVDETAYIYIIFNLIKNALYYFKSYPESIVTITVDGQAVTVTDTGPGIPEHILNNLFKNFSTANKPNGTGLGLAYCHRTMQAFHGKISCTSVFGQSTTFTLKFPVIAEEEINAHIKHIFRQALPILSNKRVLIVDDQPIYYLTVGEMLEDLCCDIDTAENGQLAIEMLKTKSYDLIIMDLVMPVKNGYVTTEEIRSGAIPHQKNIAIVAHTTESPYRAKVKAQKVGMDGFLNKSCTQHELIKTLCHALRCAERRDYLEHIDDSLTGKTILIIDDELINRQYLEIYVKEWGMHTLHAESGQIALDMLESTPGIDIVFMDMNMPLLNGAETTRRIRANPRHSNLIIVALTGNFTEQFIEEAKASGMNAFIAKPFDKTVLRQKLIQLITAKDQHEEKKAHANLDSKTSTSTSPKQEEKQIIGTELNALTDSLSNRYLPKYTSQADFFKNLPLIDYARLTSVRSNLNNKFQEFLQRFARNLLARNEDLRASVSNNNMEGILEALHSILGVAGYVGAHALHQYVKLRLYSEVYAGRLPEEEAWAETVHALVKESVEALQERHLQLGYR